MKSCSKIVLKSLVIAMIMTAVTSATVACTDVDDTLGMGMLPENQIMKMGSVTIKGGVNTYMTKSDSIPTKHLGRLLLGSYKDDNLGVVSCSGVLQIVPSGFNQKYYFGYKPVVDSVTLSLYVGNIYGDTDVEQRFYIYEVNELLDADTSVHYYSNFDARAISNISKPLFSFTIKGETKGQKSYKLTREAGGRDFISRLINLDTKTYDLPDTVFRNLFNGLYIAPSDNLGEAPKDAALYDMTPLSTFPYDQAFITIHGYSLNKEDEEKPLQRKDTLLVNYSLNDSKDYHLYPSTSVGVIKHDYAGTTIDPSKLLPRVKESNLDSVKLLPSLSKVYVQGVAGVATYLNFTDEFVAELKSKAVLNGKEHILMVNRAMIYMWIDDDQIEIMDKAPTRLGMYHDLKGEYPKNILDYMYKEEQAYEYQSTYRGYLNRGHGYYEMDVSMYMRMLLSSSDYVGVKQWIYLAPGKSKDVFYAPNSVAIVNDPTSTLPNRLIEVEIWYTLIKKR